MRTTTRITYSFLAIALLPACATSANRHEQSRDPWSALAIRDLEAARAALLENHPGPVDAENPGFMTTEAAAFAAAMQHARATRTLFGHEMTLRRYVRSFRDGHLSLGSSIDANQQRWPGFVVGWRAGRFLVMSVGAGSPDVPSGLPTVGDELVSCDGRPASVLLREDVFPYFGGHESRKASFTGLAPLLFDDRNPFRALPAYCRFGTRDIRIEWRTINARDLGERRSRATFGPRPAPDLRPFGPDGVWISAPSFSNALVKRAVSEQTRWNDKGIVVLDVRGNTGGSSYLGYQLLVALLGRPPAWQGQEPFDESRVSEGNVRHVETLVPLVVREYGNDSLASRLFMELASGMRQALARGQVLYRDRWTLPYVLKGLADEVVAAGARPDIHRRRVLLLTDGRCMSACTDFVAEALRYPGVIHVGQDTNADTPYMEVRPDIPLPSGLFTLSMSFQVSRGRPGRWRPYVPKHAFTGEISDTTLVEAWVNDLLRSE